MSILNLYNKAKKNINKYTFHQKNAISFKAYELLKDYVVRGIVEPHKLDGAYPKNTKLKVLKNVSQRSMRTFYKLTDQNNMNKQGMLSQPLKKINTGSKKLSPKAKKLLKKINNNLPRYENIDSLISNLLKK